MQTTSTVPAGHSERTTCSQIHLTPSGRYLYVGNRAANGSSIAAFAVDPATGQLNVAGHTPTEAVPSAFCLDPVGHFRADAAGSRGSRPAPGGGVSNPSPLSIQETVVARNDFLVDEI